MSATLEELFKKIKYAKDENELYKVHENVATLNNPYVQRFVKYLILMKMIDIKVDRLDERLTKVEDKLEGLRHGS